ncbi:MAG TPA: CoA-transferase [Actinomycetota bacterium]|nr:CoA-transferase [Actinomycetota bacterium]
MPDTGDGKAMSMQEAVGAYVQDGMSLAIEGFTAFICFAAAHEIVRQRRRDLTLVRLTPDVIYDQMIAAGTARRLVFSYLGNPGVGSLHCVRRAVERGVPHRVELEEYSHYGMVGRYVAGATGLPFFPLRSYVGSDLPAVNPDIRFVDSPYGGEKVAVVPPLRPDLAILHAQRADLSGNTQLWGLLGVQKEVAFAARRLIVVVEEIVPEEAIRSDPNRTLIPGLLVDAVVHEPYGAHPSYVQGYYDRDNAFYLEWDRLSRDEGRTLEWLDEWVHGVPDRAAYLRKLGPERLEALRPGPAPAAAVDYGWYP